METYKEDLRIKLTFGQAIDYAKDGRAVTRYGWNPKEIKVQQHDEEKKTDGSFTVVRPAIHIDNGILHKEDALTSHVRGIPLKHFESGSEGMFTRLPSVRKVDEHNFIHQYTPTHEDILAEDWTLID